MVRLDRIYTRAGDAGETSLGDGERVSKKLARIWAYGTVDETGAAIGVAIATGLEPASAELLRRVQNDLFDVGADLAVPIDTERGHGKSRLRIGEEHVAALERACDQQGERLAPLTSFVLSGGHAAGGRAAPRPHRLPAAPSGMPWRWPSRSRSTRRRSPT